MTDNTQPEMELLLNGEPYTGDRGCGRKPGYQRFAGRGECSFVVLMIETCFALPKLAHGQFLSVFDSIFSSIQNDIGSSLKTDQPDCPADAEALSDNGCAAGGHQPGPRLRREFDQQLIAGR